MSLFFTKFYLSHKYTQCFLYMMFKHKVHKALINIIQLFLCFVKQTCVKIKKRTVLSVRCECMKISCRMVNDKQAGDQRSPLQVFLQTSCRAYPVMGLLSFILIHIFIGDVHNVIKPEVFYGCCSCANAG